MLFRSHRQQPTRLRRPWDSPGKNTGVGCHFFLQCMRVKSESEVTQPCLTLATPWTVAFQAPPCMEFSRQEYWSGCHYTSIQNKKLKKKKKGCGLRFQLYHLLIYQTTHLRQTWALVFSSVKWGNNIAPYQRVVCEDEMSY